MSDSIDKARSFGVSFFRLWILGGVLLLSFLGLWAGLAKRQIFDASEYLKEYELQSYRIIQKPAPRGFIYDRNGKILVSNRPRYSITIDLSSLHEEFNAETIKRVKEARSGMSLFSEMKFDRTSLKKSACVFVLQRYSDVVASVIGREKIILDIKDVDRHIAQKRGLDFPLAKNLNDEERSKFIEHFPVDGALRLYIDSVRYYPNSSLASHFLGTLQNTENLTMQVLPRQDLKLPIYRYRGKTGDSGVEKAFNDSLQGVPGYELWQVKPIGDLYKKLEEKKPEQGAHLFCSIDIELQKVVEDALEGIDRPGAAIAIDVKTGEVLAMASYPTYDLNKIADVFLQSYKVELDKNNAMLNRVLQGRYPPGSTFKLVTGIAAVLSGIVSPDDEFDCGSYLRVDGRSWPEHDGAMFGMTNLARMIRVSSNVYCYNVALAIGIDYIAKQGIKFGLNKRIDIELPEAVSGGLIVPTPKYKRDVVGAGGWVAGDTINTAIGQGYCLTTPAHIACMVASIARRETHTKLSVIHDPFRKDVNHGGEKLGLDDHAYAELLRGMTECVEYGTGKRARVEGLTIAGKTGTAQKKDNKGKRSNLAWFTGFAPVEDPKIAVAIVIEGNFEDRMAGGATAGPIAKRIFTEWLREQKR